MHTTPSDRTALRLALVLALVCLVLASGCAKKRLPAPYAQPPQASKTTLAAAADEAFRSGQYAKAEGAYTRLLEQPDLTPAERRDGVERYGQSALEAGHPAQARRAFEDLASMDPTARSRWPWNGAYVRALWETGRADTASAHLAGLVVDPKQPWEVKSEAALLLARFQRDRKEYGASLQTLGEIYRRAPNSKAAQGLEERYFAELAPLSADTFSRLAQEAERQKVLRFPAAIVRLEQARRLVQAEGEKSPQALAIARELKAAGVLAGPGLVAEAFRPPAAPGAPVLPPVTEIPLPPEKPVPGVTVEPTVRPAARPVALVLPLTGRDAAIGWKILRGAWLGEKLMAQAGGTVQIEVVNSEAPDWLDRIRALPQDIQVIGGPLRVDALQAVKASRLNNERAFFAFLSGLGELREGVDAWRFFPSPEDQARALVAMAVDDLGVKRMAVLYPQEKFGQRMLEVFSRAAADKGAAVVASESYQPGEHAQWNKSVARLLKASPKVDKTPRDPRTDFEAVFIPDSWKNAQMLAPQFFFYEEDRLVILGPELWGTAPAATEGVEAQYFRLSAFPTAWWPDNPAPSAQALLKASAEEGGGKADFWVALGFDFARFAAALGPISPANGYAGVNEAIRKAQAIDWCLAPISWDGSGAASQAMFLFTPAKGGPAPTETESMRARLQTVKEKHAERFAKIHDAAKAKTQ